MSGFLPPTLSSVGHRNQAHFQPVLSGLEEVVEEPAGFLEVPVPKCVPFSLLGCTDSKSCVKSLFIVKIYQNQNGSCVIARLAYEDRNGRS